jgi:hypothetical protein
MPGGGGGWESGLEKRPGESGREKRPWAIIRRRHWLGGNDQGNVLQTINDLEATIKTIFAKRH